MFNWLNDFDWDLALTSLTTDKWSSFDFKELNMF